MPMQNSRHLAGTTGGATRKMRAMPCTTRATLAGTTGGNQESVPAEAQQCREACSWSCTHAGNCSRKTGTRRCKERHCAEQQTALAQVQRNRANSGHTLAHLNWLMFEKIWCRPAWMVSVRGIFRPRMYLTCSSSGQYTRYHSIEYVCAQKTASTAVDAPPLVHHAMVELDDINLPAHKQAGGSSCSAALQAGEAATQPRRGPQWPAKQPHLGQGNGNRRAGHKARDHSRAQEVDQPTCMHARTGAPWHVRERFSAGSKTTVM